MARGGSVGGRGGILGRGSRAARSATRSTRSTSRSLKNKTKNRTRSEARAAEFNESAIESDLMSVTPGVAPSKISRLAKMIKNKRQLARQKGQTAKLSQDREFQEQVNFIAEARMRDNYFEIGIYESRSTQTIDGVNTVLNNGQKSVISNYIGPELSNGVLQGRTRKELLDIAIEATPRSMNFEVIEQEVQDLINIAQNIRDAVNYIADQTDNTN